MVSPNGVPVTGAVQIAVPPATVNTFPVEPIAIRPAVLEPVPKIKSPVVVIGLKALKAADAVVCPVPPRAIAIAVPAHVPVLIVPTVVSEEVITFGG